MRLYPLLKRIIESSPSDWYKLRRCGRGEGTSYKHRFRRKRTKDGQRILTCESHPSDAVFTRDIAITLAWGMDFGGSYPAPWVRRCPDPIAWTAFVDVFYHGSLVYRDIYAIVDGDRCYLPIPRSTEDMRVAAAYAAFIELLGRVSFGPSFAPSEYTAYLRRTQLEVAPLLWPAK
jgi:hypothetical protein